MQFGSDLSLLALTFYGVRDLLSYFALKFRLSVMEEKIFRLSIVIEKQ